MRREAVTKCSPSSVTPMKLRPMRLAATSVDPGAAKGIQDKARRLAEGGDQGFERLRSLGFLHVDLCRGNQAPDSCVSRKIHVSD
jgi:hypothetical protein